MLVCLALVLLSAAATSRSTDTPPPLAWWRDAGSDAPWIWLSSHLAHLGFSHWAINSAAALGLALIVDRFALQRIAGAAIVAAWLATTTGLLAQWIEIAWYAGASALLHGLFAAVSLSLSFQPGYSCALRAGAGALFLAGVGKCLLEWSLPVGTPGWLGTPLATPLHLYGYFGGAVASLLVSPRRLP